MFLTFPLCIMYINILIIVDTNIPITNRDTFSTRLRYKPFIIKYNASPFPMASFEKIDITYIIEPSMIDKTTSTIYEKSTTKNSL